MYKHYGIDWSEENACDGGLLDDRMVRPATMFDERKLSEYDKKKRDFNSRIIDDEIIYDDNTDSYYYVACFYGTRRGSKSIVDVEIDSDILINNFKGIIEIPHRVKATIGKIKIIIPTIKLSSEGAYKVHIRYKDMEENDYHDIESEYLPRMEPEEIYDMYNDYYGLDNSEYIYEYDNTKNTIEYGYEDATHGYGYKKIKEVEPYQKEDGVWTSDVVANPEQYLKSDLEWYYSPERQLQYIERKKLLPQWKIDAIRAANYEDIFSIEYRLKTAIKFLPIALIVIVLFAVLIKMIKRNRINKQ